MTWNIVSDSSCDLRTCDFHSDAVHFELVPLRLQVGAKEFVDNDELSVRELLEGGENGDIHAWEDPGAAEAAGKYLDAESVESLTVSALFDEVGSVVFAGWREEEGLFYLQEGPEEGAYYKLYSPKRGRTYENWNNERAQKSEVHRRWFAWLRDGLWKDEG